MDWPSLVRKYVWDEEKTPYLVAPGRLSPRQARSELFVYGFLLALLASLVAAAVWLGAGPGAPAGSPAVALYAASVALAAIAAGAGGHPLAAAYCATAPVALALSAVTGALRPAMPWSELAVVVAASALWLGYALRVVRVARGLRGR